MKIAIVKFCAPALLMVLSATSPAADALGEEPAVWKAMAEFIASDNTSRPFKVLYFQSDFEIAPLVTSSMADPTRKEYRDLCGLSVSDAQAMVSQLQAVNAEPVKFEESVAEPAGMKIAKKKSSTGALRRAVARGVRPQQPARVARGRSGRGSRLHHATRQGGGSVEQDRPMRSLGQIRVMR